MGTWNELHTYDTIPGMRRDVTPGLESAQVGCGPEEMVGRASRIESQKGRTVLPGPGLEGTKRSALPKLLFKSCPRCSGTLELQHQDWDYGDYGCVNCGRSWDVKRIVKGKDDRLQIELDRVGHHIKYEEPKKRRRRR